MMNMKKIAGVVAAIMLMFILAFSLSHDTCILFITNTASADYEFEFIDEDDSEDSYDENSNDTNIVYDIHEDKDIERQFNPVRSFFISLIIGLLIGLIAVSIMKSSMKSVHKKSGATDYRKQDGFKLTVKTDDHLGTKVEKSPIARAPSQIKNPNTKK